MTLSSKFSLSLAALAAFGLTARPAAAQTALAAGGSVVYGSSSGSLFQPAPGNDGSIEFDTTPVAQTAGHFQYETPTFTDTTGATTVISQPSYISGFAGFNVDHASGYGYPAILLGRQAGFVGNGAGDGGGNIFSFTVGTAKSFTFGVLANYSTNATENPNTVTLTGTGSTPVSVSDTGSGATFATEYLFSIANAAPGQTFTLSTDQGYIAGATFDPAASPAPEPSPMTFLGCFALGTVGMILKARKRVMPAA